MRRSGRPDRRPRGRCSASASGWRRSFRPVGPAYISGCTRASPGGRCRGPATPCTLKPVESPPLSVRLDRASSRLVRERTRGSSTPLLGDAVPAGRAARVLRDLRRRQPTTATPTRSRVRSPSSPTVPYFFRRHAPLPVLSIVAACVVIMLVIGDYPERTLRRSSSLVGTYTVAAYCSARERDRRHRQCWPSASCCSPSSARPASTAASIVCEHRALRGRVLLRLDDPQPPPLHGATRSARRGARARARRGGASARSPTSGCASRRSCTTSSPTRWASSRCRPASARTSSTPIRPRRRSRSKRSRATSRSTLAEIRRMLGVLREDDGRRRTRPRPVSPTSTARRAICDAGRRRRRDSWEGARPRCRRASIFTAYRIVQEALTNVLKHAGPARGDVHVGYEPDVLRLEVVDDGRGVNGRATATAATAHRHARARRASTAGRSRPAPRPAAASASRRASRTGADA